MTSKIRKIAFVGDHLPSKTKFGIRIVAKVLRQQGNGIKYDGQTSPARDHHSVDG
jgi:hypothetical protein